MSKPKTRMRRSVGATATSVADNGLQRALSPAAASWAACGGHLQEETAHFAGSRLDCYLEAADLFARCRTSEEVVDAQARFIGGLLSGFVDQGAMVIGPVASRKHRSI
jgi:hypothetical protein